MYWGTRRINPMSEVHVFPVPEATAASARVNSATYNEMYQRSITDPEGFWGEHGKRID
jgi:acetyl-CoA synthetase